MWLYLMLVTISIDITGITKFNFAVVQYINDACVSDNFSEVQIL